MRVVRVERQGLTFSFLSSQGLANLTLRDCFEALTSTGQSGNFHTLSLSTLPRTPNRFSPSARLTVAYLSHRLSLFLNLRHLTLVEFVPKPCDWTVPTYSLECLAIENSALGVESFAAIVGDS